MPDPEKTRADLEWAALCDRIAQHCLGPVAADRVARTEPADSIDAANRRVALTREALSTLQAGEPVPAGAVDELAEALERLGRGSVLSGLELGAVGRMAAIAHRVSAFVAGRDDCPTLAEVLTVDPVLGRLAARLDAAIDDDGELSDAASTDLRRARQRARDTKNELRALMGRLVHRYGDALQDAFHTDYEGRYALPVRADAPYRVEGIVLGASASGATLYVEPREATELGNRHRVAVAEVERETARLLAELSAAARTHVGELTGAFEACVTADVVMACARYASATSSVILEIDAEARMVLRQMRHPLLVGGTDAVVPNDITLAAPGGLVVSGPNAGGKTVALKCLGLAAWMARSGLPIPVEAEGSRVGWFDSVLTDIGDEQSIARSLSTFSAHTARLADYVRAAGPSTLVLLDEIAGGTDPDEGSALAVAILEALVDRGAAVAVTTHYDRLKHLAAEDSRFENASVGFDMDRMLPTFRLTLGRPGASSALFVAARFGMDAAVVQRARALLPEAWESRETLVARLETELARAESDRAEAARDRAEQARLRARAEAERERARSEERARLARETEAVLGDVRLARSQLREAKRRMRAGAPAEVTAAEKTINEAAARVALGSAVDRTLRQEQEATPAEAGPITAGTLVRVRSLGAKGHVLTPPDDRGRLTIRSGTMKLTVKDEDVEVLQAAPRRGPTPRPVRTRRSTAPLEANEAGLRTTDNTCDLRGVRVEDVEERLSSFVDSLLSRGESFGYVLHGHGTGALRSAVRERLPSVPFVAEVRPASRDEGGEAFTVVRIRE